MRLVIVWNIRSVCVVNDIMLFQTVCIKTVSFFSGDKFAGIFVVIPEAVPFRIYRAYLDYSPCAIPHEFCGKDRYSHLILSG